MLSRRPVGHDPSNRILLFAWLGWLAVFFTLISFFQLSLLYRVDLGLDDDGVKVIKSIALAMTGVGGLETVPPARRGRFGALAQTGAPLGLGLATLVATGFAPRFGWRAAFGIAAAPVLLAVWIALALPESTVWLAHRESRARGS